MKTHAVVFETTRNFSPEANNAEMSRGSSAKRPRPVRIQPELIEDMAHLNQRIGLERIFGRAASRLGM